MTDKQIELDDFRRYFARTPAALAIKECARLRVLRRYACPGPVLDVGCGDGLFASIALPDAQVWGIDIDASEGRWAIASRAYSQVIVGDITRAALPRSFFNTCIANCSLEHVPDIEAALQNIRDSLAEDGRAYLFVPHRDWVRAFRTHALLEHIGAGPLATRLQASIDGLFKHHHLYDAHGWRELTERAGLRVIAVEPVLSAGTTRAFEAFLAPSLLGLLNKNLTSRWTNFPRLRHALAEPVFRLAEAAMRGDDDANACAELLVIAERAHA